MKNLLCLILLEIIPFLAFSQNKPNVAIFSRFDDKFSYWYFGDAFCPPFTPYTQQYTLDFNCNQYIIDYIHKRLSYKFNFVEIPANIPVLEIREKFHSLDVHKESMYLVDSLRNHKLDYVIVLVGTADPLKQNNNAGNIHGWGMISAYKYATYFSYFKLYIINIKGAKFGPELAFDPMVDAISLKTKRIKKKDDYSATPEELSAATAPIIRQTTRLLDEIIPQW
ncbi:MAG: hypothetical protein WCI92_07370 [Bacteroidota bacterium]